MICDCIKVRVQPLIEAAMEINYEGKGLCERSRRACPYESVDDCSLAALASLVSPTGSESFLILFWPLRVSLDLTDSPKYLSSGACPHTK